MKINPLVIPAIAFLLSTQNMQGQIEEEGKESTTYSIEATGTAASGETTPFWLVSNKYGITPLEAGNGTFRAGVFHNQTFGDGFRWAAGADLVAVAPRSRNVYVHQLYAELGYKSLLLSIGSKERYNSIIDKRLSSGDMVLSPNARPIPEINFSIPHFTTVPYTGGWLQVKGDFAVGRSFDKDYLKDYTSAAATAINYVNDVLWHHKSGYLRIGDTENSFPLFGILGLAHWAQWGGTTNTTGQRQPQSLKDFARVVVGKEGGENATSSDQINVLGNHYGSYYFALGYDIPEAGKIEAYHQHYFDDKSGMEFANGMDGLWGIGFESRQTPWLKKVVIEHLNTRNQSGPLHFITFDHDKRPGRGGGSDNYYNNGEYKTGATYFNRALGNPLLTSPEYNNNGRLGFMNNRVVAWHLGAEGDLSPQVAYRLLLTSMKGWGQALVPFLDTKSTVSAQAEITYAHPRLNGWEFGGAAAFDTGGMLEKNAGFTLSFRKQGILKKW